MVIKLYDGYSFEAESVAEEVGSNLEPQLRFENIDLKKKDITAIDVSKHFNPENLKEIKVFDKEEDTVPVVVYTEYHYLKFFSKTIKNKEKSATMVCSITGDAYSAITG